MKTLGQLSPKAAPLALAVSLVFFSGNLRAFGPGGAGNGSGVNGVGTTGGVAVGGGAHGGVSAGGNVGGSSAASGARGGVSISNSASRAGTGGFSQGTGTRGNAPSGLSQPYRNVLNGPSPYVGTRPAGSQSVARPGNTWSGTAVNTTNAGSARTLYPSNGYTSNRFTGQILDPGANGANLPTINNWTDRGRGNNGYRNGNFSFRGSGRYYYNPYVYGPAYAPYIGYYGGGYSSYAGAYPYYNDVPTNDVDPATATVTPQYVDHSQDANNAQPDPARQQQPAAAPQNQNGNAAASGTVPANGPDSLVEAVQQELVRRGYFGGKVDAMFGSDTKDALRKFQTDHHLADTGLINEATLHALQLD